MKKLNKYRDGLNNFIRKEPFYLWLVIFIILVNILTFLPKLSKEGPPDEQPKKLSKATKLIKDRERLKKAIIEDERIATVAALVTMSIALSILIGLILDFVIFIRKRGKPLLERSLSPPEVGWDIWDGFKVIILFLFFGYIIAISEALFSPILPFLKTNDTTVSIVNTTLMDLISIIIVFYFVIRLYKHKIRDLGLTLKNFFRNIFYGIFGYLSIIPLLTVTLILTVGFINLFKYQPPPQPVLEIFLEEERHSFLIYIAIFVAIAGPIMEEIFFRGFLYNAIKKETNVKNAIFISAVLFSFLHAHLVGFLPILILGIFLAYLYEKTGSLIPSITVHVIHNMVMVSFVFLVKGIKFL